ncbi:MAG: MarR family transcriptional regulator [Propionicimonas sp.]|uniref:MarR family winged helix-turn-helix transcriptional regulator n=1 Tax=Propionicimonas sp. TaxID=1955623 RepID=UPI002B1FC294|nr:MarR family transcriptional regulator [Propionicimonas sp.]MEA4944539.1 MarR family transcriptional regulator [Propionicimonas sp.]MEA5118923.1 MarR family transcriptional regulator [Propionicimonas sp.]
MSIARAIPDELTSRFLSQASWFVRTVNRRAGMRHSLVAMRVLSNLQHEGDLRVGELAAREAVSQPTMTVTVNRLEQDGLVTRHPDPSDARASVVRLTASGLAELQSFRSRAAAVVRPVLADLDGADLATLTRAAELFELLSDRLAQH